MASSVHAASTLSVAGLMPITASPAAEQQAVEHGGGDAARIVGRMVRLQPHREPPGQADRVAEARDDAALARDGDQVLDAHQLADRGDHLGREAGAQRGQRVRFGGEQQLAELADGERGDRRERRRVVAVDDQPGDLVGFVRNHRLGEERRERQVGQRHLRRDALGRAMPRRARRARRRSGTASRAPAACAGRRRRSVCRRACARRSSGLSRHPAPVAVDPEEPATVKRFTARAAPWRQSALGLREGETDAHRSRVTAPIAASRAKARLERVTDSPLRLWPSLTAAWTRRLDRRIEDDLRWLDPGPSVEDSGARRVAERRAPAPRYPLTADLAGVLAPRAGAGDGGRSGRSSRSASSRCWAAPAGAPTVAVADTPLDSAPPSAKRRRSIGTREAVPPPVARWRRRLHRGPRDQRTRTRDMAKKIAGYIKLQIPAGKANPSPPVGPALGQRGLNIMRSARTSTRQTQNMEPGMPVPVVITAFADRTFSFITKTPPNTYFLMKAAKIDKGSQTVGKSAPVGQVTMSQLREIAEQKMKDMNANDVDGAVRMLMGSARSMGITVVEG